jgi:hypothetical protein
MNGCEEDLWTKICWQNETTTKMENAINGKRYYMTQTPWPHTMPQRRYKTETNICLHQRFHFMQNRNYQNNKRRQYA